MTDKPSLVVAAQRIVVCDLVVKAYQEPCLHERPAAHLGRSFEARTRYWAVSGHGKAYKTILDQL